MKKYWQYFQDHALYIFLLLISCYLLVMLIEKLNILFYLGLFLQAISPLLIGILIALFLHPFIVKCRFLTHHKSRVSFVYGLLVIGVLLFLVFLIPMLYLQIEKTIQYAEGLIQQLKQFFTMMGLNQLFEEKTQAVIENGSKLSIDFIFAGANHVAQFFFAFFIAYFISLETDVFINEFKKLVVHYEKWWRFYHTFSSILYRYTKGVGLDMVFIVLSVGFLLSLFHFPQPFFLAFLLAFLNLLPYLGAVIGVGLIALVGILTFESIPWLAIILLILLQQIEGNVIHPLILNKSMSVHPLYLFAALLISEFLFGVIGIILSPLLAAFMQIGVFSYLHVLNHSNIGGWENL